MNDAEAQRVLARVVGQWREGGQLGVLLPLVEDVWHRNVDRHETRLGDDAMTLGIQSSRNLMNLSAPLLRKLPQTIVKSVNTLEVSFAGRVLHTSKAPSSSPNWDVHSIDWSSSEVRHDGATANTAAYMPISDTLLHSYGALPQQPTDPEALGHLHLTWQGMPDGETRCWIGFPCLDYPAWFAVFRLDGGEGGHGGLPVETPKPPTNPRPDFDSLSEPELEVIRRSKPKSA